MNRMAFALAAFLPFAGGGEEVVVPQQVPLEIVGPSVLMNATRRQPCAIFDLRPQGRKVPGATRDLEAPIVSGVPVFVIGNVEAAQKWASRRHIAAVQVVPPAMIEFENMPGVPQMTPQAARANNRHHWPLFDVSEQFECDEQRLPGSTRLDYGDFQRGAWDILPRSGPFIVACRVGHRSQLVVRRLRAAGYEAYNLCGGLWGWECRKLPLVQERS